MLVSFPVNLVFVVKKCSMTCFLVRCTTSLERCRVKSHCTCCHDLRSILVSACSQTQRTGSLLPGSLLRALADFSSLAPTAQEDHIQRVVRALMPTLAVQLLHVCHRTRDWDVSVGTHATGYGISRVSSTFQRAYTSSRAL